MIEASTAVEEKMTHLSCIRSKKVMWKACGVVNADYNSTQLYSVYGVICWKQSIYYQVDCIQICIWMLCEQVACFALHKKEMFMVKIAGIHQCVT